MTLTYQKAVEVLQYMADGRAHIRLLPDEVAALTFAINSMGATGEPVAWEITYPSGGKTITTDAEWITYLEAYPDHHVTPLYAAPPAPTVTDEMVERALKAWWSRMGDRGRSDNQLMRETLLAALQVKP